MKSIETKIQINASPAEVWNVLMNHEAYPSWNPFLKKVEGDTSVGSTIEAVIQAKDKEMTFKPSVLTRNENQEFRWLGHLFVKGLFDGEHYFRLEQRGNSTEFVHGEYFSGVLSGVLLKMIGDDTRKGFISMNEALKARVENQKQEVA